MIGIIGGTGLYKMDGIEHVETSNVKTPFGEPSAPITVGRLQDRTVAFLPRHGSQHGLLPSEINFRANIWALKSMGVTQILSVSAVGSLELEIKPGDLALPSQYTDFTKGIRPRTFFGEGLVAHISTAEPVCPRLRSVIMRSAKSIDIDLHDQKTYACVEGPRLGTKSESVFLKQSGAHLVGMTNVPEVFLAREAQMCYATIAVATDYDCWLDDPSQHVSVEKVFELYGKNIGRVQSVIKSSISQLNDNSQCSCRSSLRQSVLTQKASLTPEKLSLLTLLKK
ncbi:MAG: S-methyl-5'-thioadenosine phosphorylase [Bdellovibrionales bacterium]